MKEFEEQQDEKFEQVEIGEQEFLVCCSSTFSIYQHCRFSPQLARFSLAFVVCFLACLFFRAVFSWSVVKSKPN